MTDTDDSGAMLRHVRDRAARLTRAERAVVRARTRLDSAIQEAYLAGWSQEDIARHSELPRHQIRVALGLYVPKGER
jgi:DNA-directed RNA polymerase specialized sigma24 family protein